VSNKPIDFNELPMFPKSGWCVDVAWRDLEVYIAKAADPLPLDLNPDFQRGHVWTDEQRTRYVEYVLRGGEGGKELLFNCRGWQNVRTDHPGPYQIIDGLQRLTAVRRFLAGELRAFGRYREQFQGQMRYYLGFKWRVFELTRAEVLQFYLDLNAGGTPHAESEIERVRALLSKETGS
jgi:hypothetical protein